jgi:undecaprenyl-diphosphatase
MIDLLKKYKKACFWFGISLLASIIIPSASAVTASTTTTNPTPTSQLSVLQAIILGFVQGATEFIPISSTAHLKAIPVFFGWGDPGVAFTAVIQLGSIAAVLWYFWADLSQISQGMFKAIAKSNYNSQDFWLAVGILIGTIPIVAFGLAIKALIPDFDNSVLRSMTAIAIASIIMGLLLGAAEYFGSQKRSFKDLTAKDGMIIGLAQALALIPGVSRSGSTMTAGLFYNLDRATAARFSFLLGIPAITAAGLVELKGIIETGIDSSQTLAIVAGLISSAIFSYLAIAWLIKFLQKRSTWVFVWYRLGFGIFILAAISLGKI